jgi:hypothetical protein
VLREGMPDMIWGSRESRVGRGGGTPHACSGKSTEVVLPCLCWVQKKPQLR